ncbi:MAG TPA: GNAT family N-acetyltransferase [Candidatus Acidoferrales bacterium]|nr:GNAT family N-acetyltransferase [Candidatus Acidoferrales bacterium]
MSAVRIEAAQNLDEEVCARLVLRNEPWITLGYGADDIALIVRSAATSNLLLARSDDEVIGFALSGPGFLCGEYLKILAVDSAYHRQGVGRALMSELERRAFATWPNVYLCVTDFNQPARRFYANLGYVEVGVLHDLLVPGSSEILMRKSVAAWRGYRAENR